MKAMTTSQRWKYRVLGFLIGVIVGALVAFNIFFLIKVIPHGGI